MKIENFNPDRAIFLFDGIYDETAKFVIEKMLLIANDSKDDIFLFINSYGGSVNSLNAILDAMATISNDIATIIYGEADSAAAVLASSGTKGKRYIGENSKTMIHEVSGMAFGTLSEIKEQMDNAKEFQDALVAKLAKNTGKTKEEINDAINGKDFWMNASEAIAFGMSDIIISSNEEDIMEELFDTTISASGKKRINIENLSIDIFNSFANNIKKILKVKDVTSITIKDLDEAKKIEIQEVEIKVKNEKKENDMSNEKAIDISGVLERLNELTNSNKDLQQKFSSITSEKERIEKENTAKIAELNSKLETEKSQNKSFLNSVRNKAIETLSSIMNKSVPFEKTSEFTKILTDEDVSNEVVNSLINVFESINTSVLVDKIDNTKKDSLVIAKEPIRIMKRK